MPAYLRATMGLDPTDNPVDMPRFAEVWPGNGSLENPPAIVYNGGRGSTAAGNANSSIIQFHTKWPEAVVIYTEATILVDRDGSWMLPGDIDYGRPGWAPRFPAREDNAVHSDLPYLTKVLNDVHNLFPYDRSRIFVAGHSSGGFFTLSLAEFMPDTFKAFAALGAYADYGAMGNDEADIAEVVVTGTRYPARPFLYIMGDREDIFRWQPADPSGNDRVYSTIRQLTARNGAEIPGPHEQDYLIDLTNEVQSALGADRLGSIRFDPVELHGAEVVLTVYGGDHSWPPRDADDTSMSATDWIIDFFKQHLNTPEPGTSMHPSDKAWRVPVFAHPVLH